MSGYGRAAAENDTVRVTVEIRSVNHRFCRITLHFPPELAFFEAVARKRLRDVVQRGKVDVNATVSGPGGTPSVHVDRDLAASYRNALRQLGDELGLFGDIEVTTMASLPGVLSIHNARAVDAERDAEVAGRALDDALTSFQGMREAEGEHLAEDLADRFGRVEEMAGAVDAVARELPGRYRDQLRERIHNLCEDVEGEIDPSRLAQEVAYHADRADITEELVRLRSHVAKARELLGGDGAVGRSLEFLLQELHREINTIGSKAKAMEVADTVVELKSELERIREQAQNIE